MGGTTIQTIGSLLPTDQSYYASARDVRYSAMQSPTFQESDDIFNNHSTLQHFSDVSEADYLPSIKSEGGMTTLTIGDVLCHLGDPFETNPDGLVTKSEPDENLFGTCQTQPPLPPFDAFYISNPYDSFHGA